jgi:hypothetical protein
MPWQLWQKYLYPGCWIPPPGGSEEEGAPNFQPIGERQGGIYIARSHSPASVSLNSST